MFLFFPCFKYSDFFFFFKYKRLFYLNEWNEVSHESSGCFVKNAFFPFYMEIYPNIARPKDTEKKSHNHTSDMFSQNFLKFCSRTTQTISLQEVCSTSEATRGWEVFQQLLVCAPEVGMRGRPWKWTQASPSAALSSPLSLLQEALASKEAA